MSTELNSSEKIKRNMEVAMEWMSKLDYRISSVDVFDFAIILIANSYSIEFSNKVLEVAREKGISFSIERCNETGFLHYTSNEIGLEIVFTD
jgi:hypothetical protein